MAMMRITDTGGGSSKKTSSKTTTGNTRSSYSSGGGTSSNKSSSSNSSLLSKIQSYGGSVSKSTGSNKSSSNSSVTNPLSGSYQPTTTTKVTATRSPYSSNAGTGATKSNTTTRSDYSSNGGTLSNNKNNWQLKQDPSYYLTDSDLGKVKDDVDDTPKNNGDDGGNNPITDSVPDTSSADAYASYIAEYKAMVKDYQNQLDKLAEENYKLQVQQNEKNALDQRNQANLNSKMTEKWLNQQYGNEVSGAGISNRLRNRTALGNTIAEINNNLFNNNSTASLNRYNTISNNAKDALSKYQTIDDSYLSYLKKIAL